MASESWEFTVDKGLPPEQWERKGKPEWPHHLELRLTRYRALEWIALLARSLQLSDAAPHPLQSA